MGMGINTGSKPKQYFLNNAMLGGCKVYCFKLIKIITDKKADFAFNSKLYILIGLVVSVKIYIFHGKACMKRGIKFSGGNHINTHFFFGCNRIYFFKTKSLAGIKRHGSFREIILHRFYIYTHFFAYFFFVNKIKGS